MDIPVYPNLKKIIKMVRARYNVFDYIPFTSCKISVQLFSDEDRPVETRIYELNKENGFLDWGNDDKFLSDWVKAKLQEDNQ